MIAGFIPPDDRSWQEFLREVPHDFYHRPEYVSFAGRHEGGLPTAFLVREGEAGMLIPLLLRVLPETLGAPRAWRDAGSPYGYPSPLLHPATEPRQVESFLRAFIRCCRELDIITVFLRFHPLLSCSLREFTECGSVMHHGRTVWIDLTANSEDLWRHTRLNHRRGIAKLQQTGFFARIDHWNDRQGFIEAYAATMERLQAHSFYRFSERYFSDLQEALGRRLHLCAVISPEREVAAAGLFTVMDGLVQYHLGGTSQKYLDQAPSKLMFCYVRDWAKEVGNTTFHLGGGVGGRDDTLFRFKQGFSNLTSDFYTCRMVMNQVRYSCLSRKFMEVKGSISSEMEEYFPLYRGGFCLLNNLNNE